MNPTKKQKAMLDFIDQFIKDYGYSPTLREVMSSLNYKSVSTVAKHVDNLIARGWLIKRDGEARSLEVVQDGPPVEGDLLQGHRRWLKEEIQTRLDDASVVDEDKNALRRVGEIFEVYGTH